MVKLIIKSEHKALLKKIIYKGKKYCLKSYKKSSEIKLYKYFIYSLLLVIPAYPIMTSFSDKYEKNTVIGKIDFIGSNQTYIDNPLLNTTLIKITTQTTLAEPQIFSFCPNNQQLIKRNKLEGNNEYLINFQLNKPCSNNNIYIGNGNFIYLKTGSKLNIISYSNLFDEFTNYNNNIIRTLITKDNTEQIPASLFETIRNNNIEIYKKRLLKNILQKRQNLKYIIPVAGKELPIRHNIIPNAGRPYRANYTDGIHHGWDIFAARGTPVRALGYGIIYRIRNDFCWESFDKILWKNLTNNDRLINLDVYRGNQVWIKTYDGNITIYSHLESIPTDLYEGQIIKAGEFLGKVGKSGVPDKEYTDFHLHFEIQMNPHTYKPTSLLDVMQWPFFGKGESYDKLIEGQNKLFVK